MESTSLLINSRTRTSDSPIGLKNTGNTCYFNSLLQFYFMIPSLVHEILTFTCPVPDIPLSPGPDSAYTLKLNQKSQSISLIKELQRLFSYMISSKRTSVDPSKVLNSLLDDFGYPIKIGEQNDVGELHTAFIQRIEEGLKHNKINRKLKNGNGHVFRSESLNALGKNLNGNVIARMFYARQVECLKFSDGNILKNEVTFSQVLLDVEEKNLYSAWDASYHSRIDGYLNGNEKCSAYQEIWPKEFPDVLFFQIKRVKFDKVSQNAEKNNKAFRFPLEIYADRFLLENKRDADKLRFKMLELQRKARVLESCIDMFNDYLNSDVSVSDVISTVKNFIRRQKKASETEKFNPSSLGIKGEDIKTTNAVLKNYQKAVKKTLRKMQKTLEKIYLEIDNLFSTDSLRKHLYVLHSILIHEGQDNSGHYYTYIHDRSRDKWRKYSDCLVSEVTFEEVMKNSIGGKGLTSAYCLLYTRRSTVQSTLHSINLDLPRNLSSAYFSLIPKSILSEIESDNKAFLQSISLELISVAISLYHDRLNQISEYSQLTNLHSPLINFFFYLKANSKPNFYKTALIVCCIKEVFLINQQELSDDLLQVVLEQELDVSIIEYLERIHSEKQNFLAYHKTVEISIIIKRMLIEDKLEQAFKIILVHSQIGYIENYEPEIIECMRVLSLMVISKAFSLFFRFKYEEMLPWLKFSAYLVANLLPKPDFIAKVVESRLKELKILVGKKNIRSIEKIFNQIWLDFDSEAIFLHVGLDEIPEEFNVMNIENYVAEPMIWKMVCLEGDIAFEYINIQKEIEKSDIGAWFGFVKEILVNKNKNRSIKIIENIEKQKQAF